jgi:hypothetical protein
MLHTEDSVYKELEHVFDRYFKYRMKILLGNFNARQNGVKIFMKLIMIMELG